MKRKSSLKKTPKGSALSLMMLVVALLMAGGVALIKLGMHSRMMAVRSVTDITARSAADSALAFALCQINENLESGTWDDSALPTAENQSLLSSDAYFDYEVTKNGSVYHIQGTGRAGYSSHTVTSSLRLYSPFDYAVFARETLEMKNGSLVDWINNDANDWPLQVGTKSTNTGAVILKNSTTINGDVVVGVGADPEDVINAHSGASYNEAYSLSYEPALPSVVVPDYLDSMSSGGDIKNDLTISTSGKYDDIDLGNNEELIIDEPVELYITGDITLGNGAKIIIGGASDTDNDASLIIYLAGDLDCKNGSELNNETMDSTRFAIYCLDSCQSVVFHNSANFYGALYAPSADIELKNSADIYGSLVGNTIIQKNSANIYYDALLRDRTVNDKAVQFVISRWSE